MAAFGNMKAEYQGWKLLNQLVAVWLKMFCPFLLMVKFGIYHALSQKMQLFAYTRGMIALAKKRSGIHQLT
jgi:hypothetical protein